MSNIGNYEEADSDYITNILGDSNSSSHRQRIKQPLSSYFYITFRTILLITPLILFTLVFLVIIAVIYRRKRSKESRSPGKSFKEVMYHKINKKSMKDIKNLYLNWKESMMHEDDNDSENFKSSCEILPSSEQNRKSAPNQDHKTTKNSFTDHNINYNSTEDIKNLSNKKKGIMIPLEDDGSDSERLEKLLKQNGRNGLKKPSNSIIKDIKYSTIIENSAKGIKSLSHNHKEFVIPFEDDSDSDIFESSCEILPALEQNRSSGSKKPLKNILKETKSNIIKDSASYIQGTSHNQKESVIYFEDDENFEHFGSKTNLLSTPEQNERIENCSSRYLHEFSNPKNLPEIQTIPENMPSSNLDAVANSCCSHFTDDLNTSEEENIKIIKKLQNPYDLDESEAFKVPMSSYESDCDSLSRYALSPTDWLGINYEEIKSDNRTMSEAFLVYGKKTVFQDVSHSNVRLFHSS